MREDIKSVIHARLIDVRGRVRDIALQTYLPILRFPTYEPLASIDWTQAQQQIPTSVKPSYIEYIAMGRGPITGAYYYEEKP